MPRTIIPADTVAEPVRARGYGEGKVLGCGKAVAYIDVSGFVVVVGVRRVPLLPNAIGLSGDRLPPFRSGAPVDHSAHSLTAGGVMIDLRRARVWNPTVATNDEWRGEDVAPRCAAVLDVCGAIDVEGADDLVAAIGRRDAPVTGEAARGLLGRGGGLTPQGDDVIAGAAAALGAFAACTGITGPALANLRGALVPDDLRGRTTSLSATLIELAAAGRVASPLASILNLGAHENEWRRALTRLMRLGHSTGRTWAASAAWTGAGLAGLFGGDVFMGVARD